MRSIQLLILFRWRKNSHVSTGIVTSDRSVTSSRISSRPGGSHICACIREVLCSHLRSEVGCPDFPMFVLSPSRKNRVGAINWPLSLLSVSFLILYSLKTVRHCSLVYWERRETKPEVNSFIPLKPVHFMIHNRVVAWCCMKLGKWRHTRRGIVL
jgi:hypothetical protein